MTEGVKKQIEDTIIKVESEFSIVYKEILASRDEQENLPPNDSELEERIIKGEPISNEVDDENKIQQSFSETLKKEIDTWAGNIRSTKSNILNEEQNRYLQKITQEAQVFSNRINGLK